MSEKYKKALRIAVNVGCGFEGDAEDATSLLGLIETNEARIAELEAEVTKGHELQDSYCDRIAELKGAIEILEDQQREVKNHLIDKNLHIDSLYEEGYKLQQRIAELELENKKLFIHNSAMFKKLMSLDSPNDTQTQTIVYGKEDSEVQE